MATRFDEQALRARAAQAGVISAYVDGNGVRRQASLRAVRAVLDAIGGPATGDPPPVVLIDAGSTSFAAPDGAERAELRLEDGSPIALTLRAERLHAREPIPVGAHVLEWRRGRREVRQHALAAPRTLAPIVRAAGRTMTVFLPLQAVRGRGGFGVATYSDLAELVTWTRSAGASYVGALPLLPLFLDEPFDCSPYAPVTKLQWGEHFVDPTRAPEWAAAQRIVASAAFRREAARARRGDLVDYRLSWRLLRAALQAMAHEAKRRRGRWAEVVADAGEGCAAYAAFRGEREGDADTFLYAQALARRQMRDVARLGGEDASPLYLDIPLGVHPDGYDVRRWPHLFLHGCSAGAPPDALATEGQVWGFPPMHPEVDRREGYAYFRATLRHALSAAGMIRIDHVMGLVRVFCVPSGMPASEGVYVRQHANELFAALLIEAWRANAVVVGEDLGTVPPEVRRIMRRRGLLGMHVQQFAFDPSKADPLLPAPGATLASLNTHDTPTFAGFWHGDDVKVRRRLCGLSPSDAKEARRSRAALRRAVAGSLAARGLPARSARAAARSLMTLQARGAAAASLVNLEDLWGERRPFNVPGTCDEHPNWRRRAARSLAQITNDPSLAAALRALARARSEPTSRRVAR